MKPDLHNLFTIMIVSEKKKLNKFQQRSIPRNKDLFSRVGSREMPMHDDGHIADFNGRLIDNLAGSISDFETQMLRDRQMPLDTDTTKSSVETHSSVDE